jgi:hypothetical protein
MIDAMSLGCVGAGLSKSYAETIAWGRKYIDLTYKYVDLFKASRIP